MVDKAMNIGRLVGLSGSAPNTKRDVRVFELRWRSLRAITKDLVELGLILHETNPGIVWTELTSDQTTKILYTSSQVILDRFGDLVETLMADASSLEVDEVRDLTVADFQLLLLAVMQEQGPAIRDFFILKSGVAVLRGVAPDPPTATGKKGRSPAS